MVTQEEDD